MKKILIVLSIFAFLAVAAADSFARAGKGKSSGFRDSKQQPSQTQPGQQNINKTPAQAQPMQKPSFFNSGMFKWLVGGLFIGALLSMLMGHGFAFGTPGLLEILIIGGIIFLIIRMVMKSRQKEKLQYATGSYAGSGTSAYSQTEDLSNSRTSGLPTISVNEKLIKDIATSTFKLLQDAWTKGDLTIVQNLMTDRMYKYLDSQLQELKSQGLKNVVEIVYFQNVDIVDVEGEDENKVVIVQIDVMLRDYTLDRYEKIVEGSKDTPVDVKEYWAFVGKALEWKLDDIKQVSA